MCGQRNHPDAAPGPRPRAVAELDDEYIGKMEDVLETYEKLSLHSQARQLVESGGNRDWLLARSLDNAWVSGGES